MLYAILWASPNSTQQEIRKNYKSLSRNIHPDKANAESKHHAEEAFRKLEESFKILSCPVKRQLYDLYGMDGVETYYSHSDQFAHCFEDPCDVKSIEKVYLTIKATQHSHHSFENFQKQKLIIKPHCLLFSNLPGARSYSPFMIFMLTEYDYEASVKLLSWLSLEYALKDNSFDLHAAKKLSVLGEEIDLKSTVQIMNPLEPQFIASKAFFKKYVLNLKLQIQNGVPIFTVSGMYAIDNLFAMVSVIATKHGHTYNLYTTKSFDLSDNWSYRVNANLNILQGTLKHKLNYKWNNQLSSLLRLVKTFLISRSKSYHTQGQYLQRWRKWPWVLNSLQTTDLRFQAT